MFHRNSFLVCDHDDVKDDFDDDDNDNPNVSL